MTEPTSAPDPMPPVATPPPVETPPPAAPSAPSVPAAAGTASGYVYADVPNRVIAYIIDSVIVFVGILALGIVLATIGLATTSVTPELVVQTNYVATVIAGMWPDAADDEHNTAWVRDYYEAIAPHSVEGGAIAS